MTDHLSRCKQAIERNMPDGQSMIARHILRRKVRTDLRAYFDSAINELIVEGKIDTVSTGGGGTMYTACTRPPTSENHPHSPGLDNDTDDVRHRQRLLRW
jgi:hypothetical protein